MVDPPDPPQTIRTPPDHPRRFPDPQTPHTPPDPPLRPAHPNQTNIKLKVSKSKHQNNIVIIMT